MENEKNKTIVFAVKYLVAKGIFRKIELKTTQTLKDLHNAIQDYLEWDNDHMYSFFMDNKFYSQNKDMEYACSCEDAEKENLKTADKAGIGGFNFKIGQKFAYLFDFGDDHCFEIKVLDFGIYKSNKKYPSLLESKGNIEQYPDYCDENEEE